MPGILGFSWWEALIVVALVAALGLLIEQRLDIEHEKKTLTRTEVIALTRPGWCLPTGIAEGDQRESSPTLIFTIERKAKPLTQTPPKHTPPASEPAPPPPSPRPAPAPQREPERAAPSPTPPPPSPVPPQRPSDDEDHESDEPRDHSDNQESGDRESRQPRRPSRERDREDDASQQNRKREDE